MTEFENWWRRREYSMIIEALAWKAALSWALTQEDNVVRAELKKLSGEAYAKTKA